MNRAKKFVLLWLSKRAQERVKNENEINTLILQQLERRRRIHVAMIIFSKKLERRYWVNRLRQKRSDVRHILVKVHWITLIPIRYQKFVNVLVIKAVLHFLCSFKINLLYASTTLFHMIQFLHLFFSLFSVSIKIYFIAQNVPFVHVNVSSLIKSFVLREASTLPLRQQSL